MSVNASVNQSIKNLSACIHIYKYEWGPRHKITQNQRMQQSANVIDYSDCWIVCPYHIFRKTHETAQPNSGQNLLTIQKSSCGFTSRAQQGLRTEEGEKTVRSSNLKLLQGWMTHLPTAFWRSFSFNRAFLLPNSFMASLLSDGWNNAISWSRRSLAKVAGLVTVGLSSSFGVPYRLISSPAVQ